MLLEIIFLFLIGLVFGSFVSAISWRIPRNTSFLKGRSMCDSCKHKISWYDNIPLFSYIFLKGKCRYCNNKISLRYPLIEIVSGIGFAVIAFLVGFQNIPLLIYVLAQFVILLTIFVIDLENQIIPDSLVFAGIGVWFIFVLISNPQSIFANLFSGFLASLVLFAIYAATRGKGMGLGDVKFAVLGGIIVGMKLLFVWLFASFLTGGIIGAILLLLHRAKLKTKIAFGPFLIVGMAIALTYQYFI